MSTTKQHKNNTITTEFIAMTLFHERLQRVANIKKMDQQSIVEALKKNKSAVSRWWNGKIIPGTKNMRALADLFGCDYYWLKNGEGYPYEGKQSSQVAMDSSTFMNAERDMKNITRDGENFVLSALERAAIEMNREKGGDAELIDFMRRLSSNE